MSKDCDSSKATISQVDLIQKLRPLIQQKGRHYRKSVNAWIRPAVKGEKISTWTADGLETEKIAEENEYLVKNPGGETYLITQTKYNTRYRLLSDVPSREGFRCHQAIGEIWGLEYNEELRRALNCDSEFFFTASWGSKMRCMVGDVLASPDSEVSETYRIARKEFDETYRAAEE